MRYKVDGNHIEIYFDTVPSDTIRETLKICGWHWFGKKKCWSATYSPDNLIWAQKLSEEMNPNEKMIIRDLKKQTIGMHDLVVRCNSFYCNLNHELEDMAGEIDVIDKKGYIQSHLVPIAHCKKCDVYYILEDIYVELKEKGMIRCQILTLNAYRNGENSESLLLNPVSPLRKWGYTVGQAADYSDVQRRAILEDIVDCGALSKDAVISYLNFFIKLNHNGSDIALAKWKADRDYICNYKLYSSKKVHIDRIIVHRYLNR